MAEAEMVRMGAIEERRELNPRGQLSYEVIQEYVRRLQNGETPPPIEADRRTGVLFSGAHRFNAYKAFFGEGWQDREIPVVWRDDLPDPNAEPARFRLLAAIANRDNGLRVSRTERRTIIAEVLRELGQHTLMHYCKELNETPESLQQLIDTLTAAEAAQLQVVRTEAAGQTRTIEESKDDMPKPGAVKFEPRGFPTGKLTGSRPVIRVLCRRLREALGQYAGSLTEAERAELTELRDRIDEALAMLQAS